MESILKLNPTVCAVRKNYLITVVTEKEALISIRVGDKLYYNHTNGIRISSKGVHKIAVPMEMLDKEQAYTVIALDMIERKPYRSVTGEEFEKTFSFKPLMKTQNINIYHLADVHGYFEEAVGAAKFDNKNIDLLILNGDISNSSDTFSDMILCYKIASEITKGEIPCVISRGNHDLRGLGAEQLASLMPDDKGNSYYTFRVGCIWGILVDTGEDKDDDHEEYGNTICCHEFRLEQEEMIKATIENSSEEYDADGVKYKLVISHVPFTFPRYDPFDIEKPLFASWAKLMKDNIKPDIMLCGHIHRARVSECGSELDKLGHPCTVVTGSQLSYTEDKKPLLAGAYLTLNNDECNVVFNTDKEIMDEKKVEF